jgi:hypothetical protein
MRFPLRPGDASERAECESEQGDPSYAQPDVRDDPPDAREATAAASRLLDHHSRPAASVRGADRLVDPPGRDEREERDDAARAAAHAAEIEAEEEELPQSSPDAAVRIARRSLDVASVSSTSS